MYKVFLRATRALMAAATSLHISSLRAGARAHHAYVAGRRKITDVATVTLREAQEFKAEAVADEKEAVKARDAYIRAAQIEANSLRRGVVIG